MKKILVLFIIFIFIFLFGCSNVKDKKDNKNLQIEKQSSVQNNSKSSKYQFLIKISEGMVYLMPTEKIDKDKDFGICFKEGMEMASKKAQKNDMIMLIMEFKDGNGQAVMSEYNLYNKFEKKEIPMDEYLNTIIVKDMSKEEMEKTKNNFK